MSHVHSSGDGTYLIELDQREAEVLVTILTYIGGAPTGPRGVAEELIHSLYDVGVTYESIAYVHALVEGNAGIYFKDHWPGKCNRLVYQDDSHKRCILDAGHDDICSE